MKNTSRKPYIYKVTNLENHQYYIGSQCRGKTVGVNYFTSSTNKEFQEGFKNYREEKYKIEIIKEFEDPEKCGRAENYMIRNHMLLKDGLCLNRFCCCSGEKIFSTVGTHHPEETRKRISETHKGIPKSEETRKKMSEARKGIPQSEETRKRISTTLKGHPSPLKGIPLPEETRKKMSTSKKGIPAWNKGTHHSEEAKQKMSEAKKGTHHSEETRKRISETHKGIPSPRRIKISIEGEVFGSITEAAKYYNMNRATIGHWLKTKKHNAVYIEK